MSICPRCQTCFTCVVADQANEACWCTTLTLVPMPLNKQGQPDSHARCFCPRCLPTVTPNLIDNI